MLDKEDGIRQQSPLFTPCLPLQISLSLSFLGLLSDSATCSSLRSDLSPPVHHRKTEAEKGQQKTEASQRKNKEQYRKDGRGREWKCKRVSLSGLQPQWHSFWKSPKWCLIKKAFQWLCYTSQIPWISCPATPNQASFLFFFGCCLYVYLSKAFATLGENTCFCPFDQVHEWDIRSRTFFFFFQPYVFLKTKGFDLFRTGIHETPTQ